MICLVGSLQNRPNFPQQLGWTHLSSNTSWLLNPQADNQTFILTIPHCLLFLMIFMAMGVPSGDLHCFFWISLKRAWKRSKKTMSMSKCKTLEKSALQPLTFWPHIFLNSCLFWEIKNIWVCQLELYNPSFKYWVNWTMSKDFKLSKS